MYFELQLSAAVFGQVIRNRLRALPLGLDLSLPDPNGELVVDQVQIGHTTSVQRELAGGNFSDGFSAAMRCAGGSHENALEPSASDYCGREGRAFAVASAAVGPAGGPRPPGPVKKRLCACESIAQGVRRARSDIAHLAIALGLAYAPIRPRCPTRPAPP
jgi:hypothetical protein